MYTAARFLIYYIDVLVHVCSRRVRTQSEISGAGQREGQVNTGYVPEGQTSKN